MEFGTQNALTGNAKRCTKHKMLQTCDNIIGCNKLFYDGVYSSLGTCHSVIRGSRNQNYTDVWTHIKDAVEDAESSWVRTRLAILIYVRIQEKIDINVNQGENIIFFRNSCKASDMFPS